MAAVAEFDHDLDAFFRSHGHIVPRIRLVGFLETGKDSDLFLHAQIIRVASSGSAVVGSDSRSRSLICIVHAAY